MEVIPRPVKGMGLGELGGAGGLWDGREKARIPRVMFPSHPLIPADGLQFASVAHAVSQADETLSKALVYGVAAACARCSCCCSSSSLLSRPLVSATVLCRALFSCSTSLARASLLTCDLSRSVHTAWLRWSFSCSRSLIWGKTRWERHWLLHKHIVMIWG